MKPGPKPSPNAHRRHELYGIWKGLRNRCSNPKRKDFKYYGGRGIRVCERWDDFKMFVADVGPRPTPDHEIDRIDSNGNYEPLNCKWSTRFEQLQHTRRNRILEIDGVARTMAQWTRELDFGDMLIKDRLKRGWTVRRALTTPKLATWSRHTK